MMDEAIRRADEALREMVELAKSGQTSSEALRRGLAATKAMRCRLDSYQASAASVLADRERHGDGGAGVLAQAAGLSRRDAAKQVKTAERLRDLPDVRRAVEDGQVSFANAKALADAADKTSVEAVNEDPGLLAQAAALTPERFSKEADRWAAQRQEDEGEAAYRRLRRQRRANVWDGDDGMVHVHGEYDPVAGARLRKQLTSRAEELRREDLALPRDERRDYGQRMADALESLVTGDASVAGGAPTGIAIVQHLDAEGTKAFAEVVGGGAIPRSVLEEHFCNAEIVGVVFGSDGVPMWHGHTKQTATEAQKRALLAKYGGCGGCLDADPVICQAHHIEPVSQGGPTDIENLMPLCWHCHHKVHRHGWRVVPSGDLHTIEPPERIRHGPARAPDRPRASSRAAPQARRRVPARSGGSGPG